MRSNIRTTNRHRPWSRLAATSTACILAASFALAGHAQTVRPETVASGLEHPWAVAFLPEGGYLVTERPGRMRVVSAQGKVGAALGGVPDVARGCRQAPARCRTCG